MCGVARSAAARSVEWNEQRIMLLAAGGIQDMQIAAKLRVMPARWRNRFLDGAGLGSLWSVGGMGAFALQHLPYDCQLGPHRKVECGL